MWNPLRPHVLWKNIQYVRTQGKQFFPRIVFKWSNTTSHKSSLLHVLRNSAQPAFTTATSSGSAPCISFDCIKPCGLSLLLFNDRKIIATRNGVDASKRPRPNGLPWPGLESHCLKQKVLQVAAHQTVLISSVIIEHEIIGGVLSVYQLTEQSRYARWRHGAKLY